MNPFPDPIASSPWARPGLDLLAKSTLLIAAALAARRLLRRRPLLASAAGHACLLALLALPLSSRFGPPLALRLPAAERPAPAPPGPAPEVAEIGPELPELDPFYATDERPSSPAGAARSAVVPALATPSKVPAAPLASTPDVREAPRATGWPALAVGAYLLVASGLLARLAISLAAVRRLVRLSLAVDDRIWLEPLDRIRGRLGIGRRVGLAWSSRVGVPVVVGWLRPAILLPTESAGAASAGDVEAILLHELAHIRRGDYAWNVLARVVEALYWPQPLAWLLGRAVAESRELACDSYCVGQLGGPATYREALIRMAEGLIRRPGPALGLAIAGRSRLARRVAEIDRGRGEARCLSAWPARFALLALALVAALALGPARVTRALAEQPARVAAVAQAPAPAAPAPVQAPAPGKGRVLRLRVVAAGSKEPVPRATVRIYQPFREDDWRTTDAEGRIDIAHSTEPSERPLNLYIWGDGFAEQRRRWDLDPNVPVPDELTIELQPGESLGGLVEDEQGRPVSGAAVTLWGSYYDLRSITGPDGRWQTGGAPRRANDIRGFAIVHPDFLGDRDYVSVSGRDRPSIDELRAGKAVSVLKKGVPITGRVVDAAGRGVPGALVISTDRRDLSYKGLETFAVRADAEGRFRTGQVKEGDWSLAVKAPGHAPGLAEVKVGQAVPWVEVKLPPPTPFRARVVDPGGRPIEGAFVYVDTWRRLRCLGVHLVSDADGRVRWDDAPEDELTVEVDRQGYRGLSRVEVQAGPEEVGFTLSPSISLSGNVRDAETNKPVHPALFEYGAADPKTGEVLAWEKPPASGWIILHDGELNGNFPVSDLSDKYRIRITAEGYIPFVSRILDRSERAVRNFHVKLIPGTPDGPKAVALRPDGLPLAGAEVRRLWVDDELRNGLQPREIARTITTGPDGSFTVPPGEDADVILILGDESHGRATIKDLSAIPKVATRPYGRIEGRFLVGDRPVAGRAVSLEGQLRFGPGRSRSYQRIEKATTDAEGRFAFSRVIPMPDLRVRPDIPSINREWTWSSGEAVRVEDGKTTAFTLGGKGRAVVGRVVPPAGLDRSIDFTDRCSARIDTDDTTFPLPFELVRGRASFDDTGWSDWMINYPSTPEDHDRSNRYAYMAVGLAPDGSFRIDDVPPGEYRIAIRVNDEWYRRDHGPFATIGLPLTIPAGRSDTPVDLGDLPLQTRVALKAGDPAPRVEVTTLDGRTLKVPDDFRGKFVLLDFSTLWDAQSRLQVVRMNGVFDRFGKDVRFALLSLLLATDGPKARQFVADKAQPWPQAIVGAMPNALSSAYAVGNDDVPATVLIGPDGRVIATDTRNFNNDEVIARAMGLPDRPGPAPRPRPKGAIDKAVAK